MLNRITIIGHMGRDPEMRFTVNGKAVADVSVAVNNPKLDGEEQDPEWFHVVAWEKTAEILAEHGRRGARAYVEGRLKTNKWEGPDGEERQRTEIVAQRILMLDRERPPAQEGGGF